MNRKTTEHIRILLVRLYRNERFAANNTVELTDISFIADKDHILQAPDLKYAEMEKAWYYKQNRNIHAMKNPPAIWRATADKYGLVNSNYGWVIFSPENGNQYINVFKTLANRKNSRQAIMIYNRPSMHTDATKDGRKDFMCTSHVVYRLIDGLLHTSVCMRSNDVVFGYNNDFLWQDHIFDRLLEDLQNVYPTLKKGPMHWFAHSLHVYPRHYYLLKEYEDGYKS